MKKTIKGFVLGLIIATLLMSTVIGAGVKKTIEVAFNSINLTVNGKRVDADTILYEGTTYVPLRAAGEMLGKEVGWNQETKTASIDDKSLTEESKGVPNTDKNNQVKKNKTSYGLGEWWEVKNQWRVKVDSVSFTEERNRYHDKKPEAVVVIKYTYENLGYEGRSQDLYIKPDNVIDGQKKVVSSYPAGTKVSARPTPIGAIMDGAEVSYGLTSKNGDISIHFDEYDDASNKHKAVFIIPLPKE